MSRRLAIETSTLPMVCFALSGFSLLAFLLVFYLDAQDNAARLLALRAGPPPVVAIEDFEPSEDVGLAREVLLTGQLDTSLATRVGISLHGYRKQALAVPMPYATNDPAQERAVAGYMVMPLNPGESDAEALMRAVMRVDGLNENGAIVTVSGQQVIRADVPARLAERLAAQNLKFAENPVVIMPFQESREIGLAPLPTSPFRKLCLWVAAAFALAGVQLLAATAIAREKSEAVLFAPAAPRPYQLQSAKATQRFAPLIEQEQLVSPVESQPSVSFLERLKKRLGVI